MIRALISALVLTASFGALGNEALTVSSDSQAVLVKEGQTSPWLHATIQQGTAQDATGKGSHPYTYIHLDKPINFAAGSGPDHFSENAYHVYDLSFSSDNSQLSSQLERMVGKSVSVQGLISASPTGKSPTALHVVVKAIEP
ncbi:hypothetical protein [Luteibacter yeojuensis]|uniref:Uncharacterized protein n=1 Tax=Luteibacter yeojuensis TaxID=345309 RepID=A0A0F3KU75_9GAMM|nr:hypothetical protein [Luteibacter yeojuensis]KJV34820.1 hypothetical protein VI08_09595 [Luteibacter yeojuensis]